MGMVLRAMAAEVGGAGAVEAVAALEEAMGGGGGGASESGPAAAEDEEEVDLREVVRASSSDRSPFDVYIIYTGGLVLFMF